jgi:23S rRNA (uridine2552-2'-O)-methyltransferase
MGKDKKPDKKKSGRRTSRDAAQRVKNARSRTPSSQRWLERQLNDPYVREAQRQGYRSRAAFKLKEIDEKLNLIKRGMTVIDLGSAPGGWCQVAVEKGATNIIALDLLPQDPIPGVTFIQMDFMDDDAPEALIDVASGGADVVLTDMAPNTTGHRSTDHLRIMALAEAAYEFAAQILKPGGAFVAKVFKGGTENELLQRLKKDFTTVRHIKPPSSRKESAESYVAATGFRG